MIFLIPDDPGLFEQVLSEPQRQVAMKNGGVVSAPAVSILNKVEYLQNKINGVAKNRLE